jgi:hypothetical protein
MKIYTKNIPCQVVIRRVGRVAPSAMTERLGFCVQRSSFFVGEGNLSHLGNLQKRQLLLELLSGAIKRGRDEVITIDPENNDLGS